MTKTTTADCSSGDNVYISCGWADEQVREFAQRFAVANKPSWHAYTGHVREALIDHAVLVVVLGVRQADIYVNEIRSLRTRLGQRLASKHQMGNPIADLAGRPGDRR